MRVRLSKWATVFVLSLNLLLLYYSWKIFTSNGYLTLKLYEHETNKTKLKPLKRISKLITLVIAECGEENDVTSTVHYLLRSFPNLRIIVLNSITSYPQLRLLSQNATKHVKFLSNSPKLYTSYAEQYPLYYVQTKYVLFVPDSTRIVNRHSLQNILNNELENAQHVLAIPVTHNKNLDCLKLTLYPGNWSLILENANSLTCDIVLGQHAILVQKSVLQQLPNAFYVPFPYALYFQTAAQKVQIKIHQENGVLSVRKPYRRSFHQNWKMDLDTRKQLQKLYNTFDVKFVRRNRNIEWYGCSKDTVSCIHPITNEVPSYIYQGKNTPPCCLANLRKTTLYIFSVFESAGIRYWLSGGSLLGAIKTGDIISWDFNVDIGFQKNDIGRCKWLVSANSKPIVDSKGFLWEKIGESLYRVYYSRKNKIYVNLYVYHLENDTMRIENTFLVKYSTNRDFPDRFLHPMSSIEFLGRFVPTPNNINDFLEIQFSKDYLEDFKYPQPDNFKYIL